MSGNSESSFEVVIIGGALAGASTALLLLREKPGLKILIVEKSERFGRRVGEATVEISGYFLSRVLGLTRHLNERHLVKQGMRFWFFNAKSKSLSDCSEIGGAYLARVPAYQVDRAVLDEEVLGRAVAAGATLWRAAAVSRVELTAGGQQRLHVRAREREHMVTTRWVVDASGFAALLARQEKWFRTNAAHPTTALWARWKGVKDWDGLELSRKFPEWATACHGIRATATNHLVGPGWWGWCIPLKGGDTSIGLVFDQRLVAFPKNGSLPDRLKNFLLQHPVGREILSDAHPIAGDVHWRDNLPYSSSLLAGDGFVLVGDAAGFIDPFYSPGMDWLGFTVSAASRLILAQAKGEDIAPIIERHNRDFARSYQRWFQAIYQDKYEYMGDFDLMRLAFLLDLGMYYLGVVSQPFKRGSAALTEPVFSTLPSTPFFHLIRAYNRRFAAIARSRRQRRTWGRHNHARRFLFAGYTFSPASSWPILKAVAGWLRLEVAEGWRTWFRAATGHSVSAPKPGLKCLESPEADSAIAPRPLASHIR